MPEFKNKEEYERWKAERILDIQSGKYKPQKQKIKVIPIWLRYQLIDLKTSILKHKCATIFLLFSTVIVAINAHYTLKYADTYDIENSAWDGNVPAVKKYLKEHLKDPESLQGIEWSPVVKLDWNNYYVRCKYRAKNSFGGYVIEDRVFYMNANGDVRLTLDSDFDRDRKSRD